MIITLQTLIFFRESFLNALDRLLRPYYNKFSLAFGRNGEVSEDEDSDEQVFAEFDEERGVVFYPPMYLQRYAAVSDCLMDERWCGKLEKVVDLGYHDMSFIKYLKEMQGIKCILGVDIEGIPLRCSVDLIGGDDYVAKRENPLEVTLFKGNAADPDYRLIGCDAVVGIEVIEHMLPHDLDRLIHTVFGFIKPQVAIFTTPNGDFNILFKALEKNGLRRLDHFFEWSQEQFHDWCSNITMRYPQYTVSCKGIGPGPSGTKHLGCCTQMAMFVAKEYTKQQDLNLNSLALVSESPSPNSISNLISSWESPEIPNENLMIEPAKAIESYSELQSAKQSSLTIVLTTSNSSSIPIYEDKTSQCNLDSETGKSYLMFDDEQNVSFGVVKPRRYIKNKVYHIEDVYNRLNCTTVQVKKFSKTTQNLMAKNKVDTLVHTREVVDEIRHLTKLLNFNKDCNNQLENGTHTWCNINWGENAPYWNQYYKVVKEFNYPFEVKSEECRILDLISDEINRLIDAQFDEDFSFEVNKLEIPIEHLMKVVEHITDDVEKVKDILEWNGYEIIDNVVIHSRLVVDCASTGTHEDDSQETDTYSDWDSTDIRSTSMSDGSTIVPDYHARCLRRALDQKVRKLRSMLTADEDITTELDRVVCRLMKLALRTSKGRNSPPPTRWMQCKLLDLLTLTEKSIERRRRYYIDTYPQKAIEYEEKTDEMLALKKIQEDDIALKIVDKYKHLIHQKGDTEESRASYRYLDFDLNDDFSISSGVSVEGYEFIDKHTSSTVGPEDMLLKTEEFHDNDITQGKSKFERTQAWVEEDIEEVPYPDHDRYFDNRFIKKDHNITYTKYKKRYKGKPSIELNCVICKKSHSKAFKQIRKEERSKESSKTKLVKKLSRKSYNSLGVHTNNKYVSVDHKTYKVKPRRKQHKTVFPTVLKPIPVCLSELCQPELTLENEMGTYDTPVTDSITKAKAQNKVSYEMQVEIADTKQSLLMDIISDDVQETIALRRTIGTDADSMICEDEMMIRSFSNTLLNVDHLSEKHNVATENVHSQTIFLFDIDEPTTSKGIRHISMDVQCGPDATAPIYSALSATTSLTRMPKMFTPGIKIGDSITDTKIKSANFGACTYDANEYSNETARKTPAGIKINDSESNPIEQMECLTVPVHSVLSATVSLTRMPKPVSASLFASVNRLSDFTTGTNMKSIDCGSCTNNTESIICNKLTIERSIDIENKDPILNIRKQIECTTDTQDLFEKSNPLSPQIYSKQTKVLKSTTKKVCNSIEIKDSDSNLHMNIECGRNTQELNDKSVTLLRQPCKIKTSPNTVQKQRSKVIPKQKTVEFKLKDLVSKRTGYRNSTQESYKKLNASSKQPPEKVTNSLKSTSNQSSIDFATNASESHLPTEMQCSKKTPELYNIPETSLEPLSKEASILKLKVEGTSLPKTECLTNNQVSSYDGSNFKETKLLKSPNEQIIIDEPDSADECSEIQTHSTLQTSDLQVVCGVNKIVGGPGQSVCKYVKPKLCSGGVQVYSYKDKQCLSEDVMYQGEWQINRPKLLTKRKCFNPLVPKKVDYSLKKKVNSKERIKNKSFVNSGEKIHNKNLTIKNMKQHNVTLANLTKELNKNKVKQYQTTNTKVPTTGGQGAVLKPFRNIVKTPSNFRMSSASSKNTKSLFNDSKPSTTPIQVLIKDDEPLKKTKKNYIPLYLKKRALNTTKNINKNNLNLSFDSAFKANNSQEKDLKPVLIRSKTEEIKRDLVKFQHKPRKLQYVVFRNEIEKKKSDGQQMRSTSNSLKKNDASRQRATSPTSPNSSTCSSPCSIATVRAVSARPDNVSNFRRPVSNYMTSSGNTDSENRTPDKNKKFTKRCKSSKTNKENVPQTSKQLNSSKKESGKFTKSIFMGQKNDVYIAHVKEISPLQSTANTLSKHQIQISSLNIPTTVSIAEKKSSPHSQSLSKKASVNFDVSLSAIQNTEISEHSQTSNLVLVIEPQARELHIPTEIPKLDNAGVVNHRLIANWIDDTDKKAVDDQASLHDDVRSTIRELIEETLDFIDDPFDKFMIDSDTVILSRENLISPANLTESPTSFKTIITDDDNELLQSEIEFALNRSFDINTDESTLSLNDTRLTVTDFDAVSFKSITSGSKLSGYLSADNEFSSSIKLPKCNVPTPNSTSVCDIYERKKPPYQPAQCQNVPGSLANQAFSGFTINGEPVSGDQTNFNKFIDSECGSIAMGVTRQATSEELLISGRSSESFESCVLDDDSVVPDWLFQMISQQHSSTDELEPPAELLPMPVAEPMYDDNGNVMEVPGLGAGAGDGRGMHSDHSQDSSGRGTSVSSSDTSSGLQSEVRGVNYTCDGHGMHSNHLQDSSGCGTSLSSSDTSSGLQSEVILIDPAAFAAQFEMLRDAAESSVVVLTINNPAENTDNATGSRQGPVETPELVSFSRGECRRMPRAATTASDVDADVSSLDTDAPDSSDN